MNIIDIIVLSLVEGLTEFLPVSSTGHLMAAATVLGLVPSEFLKSFEIFIQLGAIMAVAVLFFRRLLVDLDLIKKIIVAFLPAGVVGFALYPVVKAVLLESLATVAWALFIGGLVLIIFEWYQGRRPAPQENTSLANLTYRQAVIIGLFQVLALIPGVSRAGATIVGGLALGLSRRHIVEFSFLLALPTMLAAVGYDLWQAGSAFDRSSYAALALGFGLSFLFALAAIKWLLIFIERHDFRWFGVYRILAALVIWLFIL